LPHLQLLNLCFVHSLYIRISQLGNVQGGTWREYSTPAQWFRELPHLELFVLWLRTEGK
jgi:hypothetical protein